MSYCSTCAPLDKHGDAVAEQRGLVDVVGDEDDRLLELRLQLQQLLLQALARDRIHGAEGLVHQEDGGVAPEGAGHPDALALTARQLVGEPAAVALRVEADKLEQLDDAGVDPLLVPAEQARDGGDVVAHPSVREQPALLDHVADAAAQLHRVHLEDVGVVDEDPPAVGSMSRLIMRSVVVLPQPEGPTRTQSSPSGTVRLSSLTATESAP